MRCLRACSQTGQRDVYTDRHRYLSATKNGGIAVSVSPKTNSEVAGFFSHYLFCVQSQAAGR